MDDKIGSPFINSFPRLPLLNDHGRAFTGLEDSSSPELVERVKSLFEYLTECLGFSDTPEGKDNQSCFNVLLRSIYPEVMIDLADLVYAQHERLAVVLSFDHINIYLKKDLGENHEPLEIINKKMGQLFYHLARTITENPELRQDPKIISFLSESYSYYLYQTRNFPWEYSIPSRSFNTHQRVLDIATGLAGFGMIYNWPANFPNLILSDNDFFIVNALSHYLGLTKKKNVTLIKADYPDSPPQGLTFGFVRVNKFLHHLKRPERIKFLKWTLENLEPNGIVEILDTDLEHHILEQSKQPEFGDKLTAGYLETLVEIEKNFTDTLKTDVEGSGLRTIHFDCRDYFDETDAFSQNPGDNLALKFSGLEILAEKPA